MEFWTIPEPNSGCLLWLGGVTKHGYVRVDWRGKKGERLNRVVWEEAHGPIPDGLHVLHKCDVRSCVQLQHFFLGTNDDNIADRVAKGRSGTVRGEKNFNAKLTAPLVRLIRLRNRSPREWAEELGVSETLIYMVRSNKIWKHVT